jgi:hypothetical protein
MEMVWHQHIGVDGHLELLRRLAQPLQKGDMVVGISENQLAVVAMLDYVMRLMWNDKTGKPGHRMGEKQCKRVALILLRPQYFRCRSSGL